MKEFSVDFGQRGWFVQYCDESGPLWTDSRSFASKEEAEKHLLLNRKEIWDSRPIYLLDET